MFSPFVFVCAKSNAMNMEYVVYLINFDREYIIKNECEEIYNFSSNAEKFK